MEHTFLGFEHFCRWKFLPFSGEYLVKIRPIGCDIQPLIEQATHQPSPRMMAVPSAGKIQ
jgi:hypothetical protein